MESPIKKLKTHAKREAKRKRIMGVRGKNAQDRRAHELKGSGLERTRKATREAVRRVGEYKDAKNSDFPMVDRKSAGGICRGGGAAVRGLNFTER